MNPDAQTEPQLAGALEIIDALRRDGHEAYFAGGCVRDHLLGVTPKDFDIATSAHPKTITDAFERTVAVGARFGVIRVLLTQGEYEVATFRADLGYSDGRRPDQVRWSSAREDVLRRDFTINGLLYDPVTGTVVDHVGGQEDLDRGVIRAIGTATTRFDEDRLRLLRAVRFAARLGFEIEAETWQALVARADTILEVSPERIRDELEKMWCEGAAAEALRLLDAAGLTARVLPELTETSAPVGRFEGTSAMEPAEGWATVLRDLKDPLNSIPKIARRLRLSNALADHVAHGIRIAQIMPAYTDGSMADRKRLVRHPAFATGLRVATHAARAGQHIPDGTLQAQEDLRRWPHDTLHPTRLVDGHALQQRGYRPGPAFKQALDAVETAQLEGRVGSEADAWAIIGTCLGPPPKND